MGSFRGKWQEKTTGNDGFGQMGANGRSAEGCQILDPRTRRAFISRSMPDGSKVGLMKNLSRCDNVSTFAQLGTHRHKLGPISLLLPRCPNGIGMYFFPLFLGSFPQSHEESPLSRYSFYKFMMFMMSASSSHDVTEPLRKSVQRPLQEGRPHLRGSGDISSTGRQAAPKTSKTKGP